MIREKEMKIMMIMFINYEDWIKKNKKKKYSFLDGKPLIIHHIDNLLETPEINDIAYQLIVMKF